MAIYAQDLLHSLQQREYDSRLKQLYTEENQLAPQRERYCSAVSAFIDLFGNQPAEIYSAPGRTELIGNHTDHQNGCVIAAAVTADTIAVVSRRPDDLVRLQSEGYECICLNLTETQPVSEEYGSAQALIRGMAAGAQTMFPAYTIHGFDAYVTSQVPSGSGMSSSASFEVLIGNIFAGLYADPASLYKPAGTDLDTPAVPVSNETFDAGCSLNESGIMECSMLVAVAIAKAGKETENRYFGKPSGLMDQLTCSVGGLLYMDFENPEHPEKIDPAQFSSDYIVCLINTGGSHADLTDEYAQIPKDMKQVASYFGKQFLREVNEASFYEHLQDLREYAGEKAVRRAVHFFEENQRVADARAALTVQDMEAFLRLEQQSGISSKNNLQNIYPVSSPEEQNLGLALTIAEQFLDRRGACRVHGGGFAGTIQAFVPAAETDAFRQIMEDSFGEGAFLPLTFRKIGGCRVI